MLEPSTPEVVSVLATMKSSSMPTGKDTEPAPSSVAPSIQQPQTNPNPRKRESPIVIPVTPSRKKRAHMSLRAARWEIKNEILANRDLHQSLYGPLSADDLAVAEIITTVYSDVVLPSLNYQWHDIDMRFGGAYLDPGIRWYEQVKTFYDGARMQPDDMLAICVAVWASRHQSDGFGGFELQVLGHAGGLLGRTFLERGVYWRNICARAERMAQERFPANHPGRDFVDSRWWRIFKYCTIKLGIAFMDSHGPRYASLKTDIVKDFAQFVPQ